MKNWLLATFAIGFTLLAIRPPTAKADEWNKRTEITFSAPVELPGIVLPAGTYVFKLADSPSNRDIVQVFNKDENKIYATILAIPDYRQAPASKTIVNFEERSAGSPEAIKEWFYPGDEYGEEFVYPRTRALRLAKNTNQNVVSMPDETAKNITKPAKTSQEPSVMALKSAPVTAVNPQGSEVEIAQAAIPKPSSSTQANAAPAQTAASAPARLPKTASDLPWILLAGCIALGLSLSLRSLANRVG